MNVRLAKEKDFEEISDMFSKIIEKVSDKSVSELLIATGLDTETAVKITQKKL